MGVGDAADVDNGRFRKGKTNTGLVDKMFGDDIARVMNNEVARDEAALDQAQTDYDRIVRLRAQDSASVRSCGFRVRQFGASGRSPLSTGMSTESAWSARSFSWRASTAIRSPSPPACRRGTESWPTRR